MAPRVAVVRNLLRTEVEEIRRIRGGLDEFLGFRFKPNIDWHLDILHGLFKGDSG